VSTVPGVKEGQRAGAQKGKRGGRSCEGKRKSLSRAARKRKGKQKERANGRTASSKKGEQKEHLSSKKKKTYDDKKDINPGETTMQKENRGGSKGSDGTVLRLSVQNVKFRREGFCRQRRRQGGGKMR